MNDRKTSAWILASLIVALIAGAAQADVLQMGGTRNANGTWTGLASIETVLVGNLNNPGELTGYSAGGLGPDATVGRVNYLYRMGKYEITAAQYTEFLNAVAKTDTYGLYNVYMSQTDPLIGVNWGCQIQRSGTTGNYSYSVSAIWANRPVNYISWGDAARFANWLQNGQPTGLQSLSTTEDGAYNLNGATSSSALLSVTRKPGAKWVIPTESEWYKAAYYDPNKPGGPGYWDYPTRSNTIPSGLLSSTGTNNANYCDTGSGYRCTEVGAFASSPSAYGTFDQGGNLGECNETVITYSSPRRAFRGGSFVDDPDRMSAAWRIMEVYPESCLGGFRVAYIPEPGSVPLLLAAGLCLLGWAWRRAKN